MGYYCTVPQCTSLAGKTKNVKFHRFPRDVTMADKWNLILKRGKPYTKYSKVCSLHFTQADYNVTTMGQWKTLSKDAVPSQNLPKLNADGTVMVIRKSRTVKYRDGKKEDSTHTEKTDNDRPKWVLPTQHMPLTTDALRPELHDANIYRITTHMNAIVNNAIVNNAMVSPVQNIPVSRLSKPEKQDAIMQTDPVQSEEDDSQNTTYDNDKPFTEDYQVPKSFDAPTDYTKPTSDYLPQTNEEYNNEAERYALERKAPNSYEKDQYKPVGYQKDIFPFRDPREPWYPNYPDSAEVLRNTQHNLQMLQEQHRVNENQNFFNESHIKQEVDGGEDDQFLYERSKELDANLINRFDSRRVPPRPEPLQHQVKLEPDTNSKGCDTVVQPQGSPYYATNGHTNVTNGYYEHTPRPGAELLIAKQNALATMAHTQLWSSNSSPPFRYTGTYYNSLRNYEDVSRILQ